MAEVICIGDRICLFCEDTDGYVAGYNTSEAFNSLYVHVNQDPDAPQGIGNCHAVVFEVCVPNRYALGKRYRSLQKQLTQQGLLDASHVSLVQAKVAAEAETADNEAENKRQMGRQVRYGQTIQLRHVLTGKYIHTSSTRTSDRDKNSMKVELSSYNAKHAQFRFQSRFRVKSDGDVVQANDQIYVESVKSPGRSLHASVPWEISSYMTGCELNINVEYTSFSVIKFSGLTTDTEVLRGGDMVSLFHCEVQAYLSAQGLLHGDIEDDVHMRLRVVDPTRAKADNQPNTSAIAYWQIELEESFVNGSVLHWEKQVRFRHGTTQLYMRLDEEGELHLTADSSDPRTVFRLYAVMDESQEVVSGSYCFIKHVLSGKWLDASKDQPFESHVNDEFAWEVAEKRLALCSEERLYANAFMIDAVNVENRSNFYYVSGAVHVGLQLLEEIGKAGGISFRNALRVIQALTELQEFMEVNGEPVDNRQKLLRNLKVVDLLTEFLQKSCSMPEQNNMKALRLQTYQVMETFLRGNSRTNELYFAKYIPWFATQFSIEGGIGDRTTTMITELIRDNFTILEILARKIVDQVVELVQTNRNYRYLDIMSVMCICEDLTMPQYQTYIAQKWLEGGKDGVFLTELGEALGKEGKEKNRVYVSTDRGGSWMSLAEFCSTSSTDSTSEEYKFLESQLDLFGELCKGRNSYCIEVISRKLCYLTWQEALACVMDEDMPAALRAKYCELIVDLFINVGSNRSVVETMKFVFEYEKLGNSDNASDKGKLENWDLFEALRPWIAQFLENNKDMTASETGQNKLIQEVLRIVHTLVQYGYYSKRKDIEKLVGPLQSLLDGRNDKPMHAKKDDQSYSQIVKQYREKDRFLPGAGTKAVVEAKCRAMDVVDMLLNLQSNTVLEKFVALFKQTENTGTRSSWFKKAKKKKANLREVMSIMDSSMFFDTDELTAILLDLSNYQYDKMRRKPVYLINRLHSAYAVLFSKAVQAQVLITPESLDANEKVLQYLPAVKRASTHLVGPEDVDILVESFTVFAELCHLEHEPNERHPFNQALLMNHGIHDMLTDQLKNLAAQKSDESTSLVLTKLFLFVEKLCRGNRDIQKSIYNDFDFMLGIDSCLDEADRNLALALTQVFTGSQETCMSITPEQIMMVIKRVAGHTGAASEFLDLLCAVVKVEELNLPIVNNQNVVMYTMVEKYREAILFPLDESPEYRQKLLRQQGDPEDLSYLMSLIDLVATCSEGENTKLEYICQSLVSLEELVDIANDEEIDCNLKRPFVRMILWSYLNSEISLLESGALHLPQMIYSFLKSLPAQLITLSEYCGANPQQAALMLKKAPPKSTVEDTPDGKALGTLHFFFDATLPFLEVLYKKGFTFADPQLKQATNELAKALLGFNEVLRPLIHQKVQLRTLKNATTSVVAYSSVPAKQMKKFMVQSVRDLGEPVSSPSQTKYDTDHKAEQEVNDHLNQFAVDAKKQYEGTNTVEAQLSYQSQREYTQIGDDEELPLGAEFQKLVTVYSGGKHKYDNAEKLINQLHISCTTLNTFETGEPEQVELDAACLRVLRALIHNAEIKMPEDEDEASPEVKELHIKAVRAAQTALNKCEALEKTLSLIERKEDEVVREHMAFIVAMLLRANRESQDAFQNYFLGTRQDSFLISLQSRIKRSLASTKQRRMLAQAAEQQRRAAQDYHSTVKASFSKTNGDWQGLIAQDTPPRLSDVNANGKRNELPLTQLTSANLNADMLGSQLSVQFTPSHTPGTHTPSLTSRTGTPQSTLRKPLLDTLPHHEGPKHNIKQLTGSDNKAFSEDQNDALDFKFRDEGNIELVLKVLALMCDGQKRELQDYLRDQPDNLKQVNMVAEVVFFMKSMSTSINKDSINLLIQLISTLNEMAVGNNRNHLVMFDSQIIDNINFILRGSSFGNSSDDQVLELKDILGQLLFAMTEENVSGGYSLVMHLCTALDTQSVVNVAVTAYEDRQKTSNEDRQEKLDSIGFNYYFLLERMEEVLKSSTEQRLKDSQSHSTTSAQMEKLLKEWSSAEKYYQEGRRVIEVLKDDCLSRIRFRVPDKDILRPIVKERVKWNIDRTSSSNKIRDLMEWSHDIMDDVKHQRKIRKNWLSRFLVEKWDVWNWAVMLLSFIINIIMLVIWDARGALGITDVPDDATELPSIITDPSPAYPEWYEYVVYGVGALHIFFSCCVALSYVISSNPRLPSLSLPTFGSSQPDKPTDEREESRIREKVFGFQTFYYTVFLAMSILGIFFHGYFFAFHLLNIVNSVQVLQRVMRAVTMNGRSLLWTFALGLIVFYLFALIAFAAFRDSLDPGDDFPGYCTTLWQCTVTVVRYGLIGEIFESLLPHELTLSFRRYGEVAAFSILFFIIITTIGLNIIFGIILDTFNQLRGEQEAAEDDMRSRCFICGRESFEFETNGSGFEVHVRQEHCMWDYVYFFIHLDDTPPCDYTTLEMYVSKLIMESSYSFFPIGRAMGLKVTDEDEQGKMMERMMSMLEQMMQKQLKEEIAKLRLLERERQEEWERQHKDG